MIWNIVSIKHKIKCNSENISQTQPVHIPDTIAYTLHIHINEGQITYENK